MEQYGEKMSNTHPLNKLFFISIDKYEGFRISARISLWDMEELFFVEAVEDDACR
jgi:hypothetical protein